MFDKQFFAIDLIGAILVLGLFGALAFDRSTTARSYTPLLRYYVVMTTFIFIEAIFMLIIYGFTQPVIAQMEKTVHQDVQTGSLIWIAMAGTLLLFALPGVSILLRQPLRQLAGAPDEGILLAKALEEATLRPNAEALAEARSILQTRGIEIDHDWLPVAGPAQQRLLDATILYILLRNWQHNPTYARFVADAQSDFDRVRQRFDRLSLRVSRIFNRLETFGEIKQLMSSEGPGRRRTDREVDDLIRKLINNSLADVCTDISLFYSDACQLLSRGLMASHWTKRQRDAAIADAGLTHTLDRSRSPYSALAYAALPLYLGIWLFFILLDVKPPSSNLLTTPQLSVVITLTQLSALAVAIVPKMRWGFANSGLMDRTPVGFVLMAGIAAVAIACVINILAGAVYVGGWAGILARLKTAAPYLISPFSTAVATAWLVQDHRWSHTASESLRRGYDALVMGGAWLGVSAITSAWRIMMDARFTSVDAIKSIGAGLVMGSVLGFALIAFFRIRPTSLGISMGHILSRARLSESAVAATLPRATG